MTTPRHFFFAQCSSPGISVILLSSNLSNVVVNLDKLFRLTKTFLATTAIYMYA